MKSYQNESLQSKLDGLNSLESRWLIFNSGMSDAGIKKSLRLDLTRSLLYLKNDLGAA